VSSFFMSSVKDGALTDEQKAGIQAARADRDKELTQWDERNDKQIASSRERIAKAGSKPGAQKRAQADLDALMSGRERIVANYEKKMFDLLTPEQRVMYNAPILSAEVQQEFKEVKLTAEQIDKVAALCQGPAGKTTEPIAPKKPPAIVKVLVGQAITTVLTTEQRKLYSDSKDPSKGKTKPTPPRKAG
jgi:Spy/CpxP family protein refolding chaperone